MSLSLPHSQVQLDIASNLYPVNFPSDLALDYQDPLSLSTFEASYQEAQKAKMPYYCISITEMKNKNGLIHKIYNTPFLRTHLYNEKEKDNLKFNIDPCTTCKIETTHYFAINCFKRELPEKVNFIPIDLKNEPLKFFPIEIDDPQILGIFHDSTNGEIFNDDGKKQEQYKVRRIQYIIADLIQQNTISFGGQDKTEEIEKWLWCSSQDSLFSLYKLMKHCQNNQKPFTSQLINFQSLKNQFLENEKNKTLKPEDIKKEKAALNWIKKEIRKVESR